MASWVPLSPPCSHCSPLQATVLVGGASTRRRRPCDRLSPLTGFPWPQSVAPLKGGLGRGWSALHGGWPPLLLAAFAVKT
ncbi:hypothetical protein BHM03_00060178 [Ensete ventricosum]|nr:hypothetical protein BHM03_00060178 [Ensete ventricosum]